MLTIEDLLKIAKEKNASDLHVTVGVPPKIRVDGDLVDTPFPKLMPKDIEALLAPVLTPHFRQVLDEKGETDFSYSIPGLGRYRVNVFKQRGSLAFVMRLIAAKIPTPEDLGLPQSMVDLTGKKRGLVLVTGPTGSGKSTSLASLIDKINEERPEHIITLEDPIEYLHNHKKCEVNQREIGLDSDSYPNALRAALREDPDVILVGEMRDLETISIALTAAETGHLVFSTLHTIGSAATIDRVIDVFPPNQQQQVRIQLASVLEAVISQQLMPVQQGRGRVAAFEVMLGTTAIKNLIRESKTHQINGIIETSRKYGMVNMDDAIYDLYSKRVISAETALSFAQDPISLQRKMY
jgi:twitching motility protein PilT